MNNSIKNNLQIFKFEEKEVRTIENDNEIWFIAKDVSEILGYSDTNALTKRLDGEDINTYTDNSSGQVRHVIIINEGGLYSAILGSSKPEAKSFKRWVTSEVLPTIRKYGVYLTSEKIEEVLLSPDTIIRIATELKNEKIETQRLQCKIEADRPKVIFAETMAASDKCILIRDYVKFLEQRGVKTGAVRFYEYLRGNGYLMSQGSSWNLPTQKAMELKLFEINSTTITNSKGEIIVKHTPKITPKGQEYFATRLVHNLLPC